MKAAYLAAAAALLAAIIAGLFSLFATPNNTTQGECSGIVTGTVGGLDSLITPNGQTC